MGTKFLETLSFRYEINYAQVDLVAHNNTGKCHGELSVLVLCFSVAGKLQLLILCKRRGNKKAQIID